jgi:hypothetical protein
MRRAARHLGPAADALQTPARVNGIIQDSARARQAEALKVWQRRSLVAWTVRVGQTLLDRYPARAVLGGQRGVPGQGRAKAHLADRQPTTSPTRIMGPGS